MLEKLQNSYYSRFGAHHHNTVTDFPYFWLLSNSMSSNNINWSPKIYSLRKLNRFCRVHHRNHMRRNSESAIMRSANDSCTILCMCLAQITTICALIWLIRSTLVFDACKKYIVEEFQLLAVETTLLETNIALPIGSNHMKPYGDE